MATESNHITAGTHNFILYKGDTWNTTLTFTDENGDPISFAGATIDLHIRRQETSDDTKKELTSGSGLSLGGGGSNVVTISTTVDIDRGLYVYDLQVTQGSSITTYLRGIITVEGDVTHG